MTSSLVFQFERRRPVLFGANRSHLNDVVAAHIILAPIICSNLNDLRGPQSFRFEKLRPGRQQRELVVSAATYSTLGPEIITVQVLIPSELISNCSYMAGPKGNVLNYNYRFTHFTKAKRNWPGPKQLQAQAPQELISDYSYRFPRSGI